MFRIILALVIITAIFSSCQKEYSSGDGTQSLPVNTYNANDSFLTKYVELDTTQTRGMDTTQKILITYDAQKRVASLNSVSYNMGLPAPADSYLTNFLYNGTDSLPYESIEHELDPMTAVPVAIPTFYGYSGGKKIYDSTIELNGYDVHRYYYSPGHLIDSSLNNNPSSPFPVAKNYRNFWFTYSAGDLSTQSDTLVSTYNVLSPAPAYYSNQLFSYDNKKNPFNRIGLRPYFYEIAEWATYYGAESNNFTETNMNFNGSGSPTVSNFHFRFHYEYNAADYPKIVRITDMNDPTDFTKGYFYYSSL